MTFTFSQPLKLLAIGGSLITSSSFWFFDHSPSLGGSPMAPIQTRTPSQPTAKVSAADDDENINLFPYAPRLENSTPSSLVDSRIINPRVSSDNVVFSFTDKTNPNEMALSYSAREKVDDFGISNIMGKRSQYRALAKEDIKIKLFKEHAWFSTSTNPQTDEFKDPLSQEEINELFTGVDETKAKQLLLSLQKRLEWKHWYLSGTTPYYFGQIPFLSLVHSPEGLKDLKIKYFSEFKELKKYVHRKVKESCTDDKKACIAYPEELTYHKTDTREYLNQ